MNLNLEKGKPVWKQIRRYKWYYILLLPIFTWYIIFNYGPMFGIAIAFIDYNPFAGILQSKWVGLHWFEYLFSNRMFFTALKNSLIINAYSLMFAFPAPIILALLLNECRGLLFKRTIQTISYLPHFISWAIIGGLITSILSPSGGFINQILLNAGKDSIYFMAEPRFTRTIIIVSGMWKGIGWGTILYLAALTNVNPELYEAATLDGAGKLKQAWYITLPSISYIIVMQLIFSVTGFIDVGFEQTFNLVTPTTYETGLVTSLYVYNMGIKSAQFSYATAVGLFQSLVGVVLLLGANYIARKVAPDGALF